jgi:hypothetical protein
MIAKDVGRAEPCSMYLPEVGRQSVLMVTININPAFCRAGIIPAELFGFKTSKGAVLFKVKPW